MTHLLTVIVYESTKEQIEHLVRVTGKPEKTVVREVVETGLKTYQTTPTKGVKALLELAEWAEKNNVTGPADLSENLDNYLWEGSR